MAMVNPKGRVNYEPNSWGGAREDLGMPRNRIPVVPADEEGDKLRIRAESFADHYSQARQFYISQTLIEQGHIADALIFELSKVEDAGDSHAVGFSPAEHRRRAGEESRERAWLSGNAASGETGPGTPHRSEAIESARALF